MSSIRFRPEVTCAITVRDMKKSAHWYGSVLGFELLYEMEEMGWCEMKTHIEGVTVGLSQSADEPIQPGGTTLVFGVEDMEQAVASLRNHNVPLDGDVRTIADMVKLANFRDPDGNLLMFAQSLSQ
ncbi:MAG: VOC family protein [Fimbriimonadia bacterium]|jgi:predicted enzyme related to lactoylglutathione lyase